jgi:hypothetical protein
MVNHPSTHLQAAPAFFQVFFETLPQLQLHRNLKVKSTRFRREVGSRAEGYGRGFHLLQWAFEL